MTKPAGWSVAAAAPDRALPPGTRIDDYEIEQTLSEGGVSIEYRAFDHALGMQVALEEYLPEAMVLRSTDGRVVLRTRVQAHAFEEGRQAFVGEAQTLARCAHPALLRIDRVLQRNGTVYRAMRLCPGPTLLAHRRALAEPPDAVTLQRWLDDLLGALAALHAEGCVHGALAPGRIVLRDDGHLLLLGFDAVRTKLISGRTQDMMAALEPCFAAPEQRNPSPGQVTGPWTDLYALATTLRYCIDGELPPPATGLAAAQPTRLVSDAWQRAPHETAADAAWLRAIDGCLAEVPQDRPQSVAELRRKIDEAVFASTLSAWPAARIAPASPNDADAAPAPLVPEELGEAVFVPPAAPAAEPATAPAPAPAKVALAAVPASVPEPAAGADSATIDSPIAPDETIAHMLADIEQTLARVAAMAGEEAELERPARAPALAPDPARVPTSVLLQPPAPWRRDLRSLWQRSPAVWLAVGVFAAAAIVLLLMQYQRSSAGLVLGDAASAVPATVLLQPPTESQPPRIAKDGTSSDAPGKSPPPAVSAATSVEPSLPTPPKALVEPPTPVAARPRPAPRAGCTGKSGYALYQCMQTQCAKRSYAKHSQCVGLRRNQSLG